MATEFSEKRGRYARGFGWTAAVIVVIGVLALAIKHIA
jgi:hypothetical protein